MLRKYFHLVCFVLFALNTTPFSMTTASEHQNNFKDRITTTLVVGATGATGKWVVKLLLDQGQNVKVVVRSEERMISALKDIGGDTDTSARFSITEAPLLDLSNEQLEELVKDCDAVVSCLGHTIDVKGMWGHPRKLVTDAARRLTAAMKASGNAGNSKFILMGTVAVANPNGKDDQRTFWERVLLQLLHYLLPPHADNESAAAYMHSLGTNSDISWTVVRPTDLIDGKPTGSYQLFDKPQGGLFGAGDVTRSHVAEFMTELILDENKWNQWKFKMPVIHDKVVVDKAKSEL